MTKIRVRLNGDSLDAAIEALESYQKKVEKAPKRLVKTAVELGAEQARDLASYMNIYDTGELVKGIVGETEGEKGAILSTAAHSAFCEFGTGVMGKSSPHPDPSLAGWRYDVNEHGEAGWWYIGKDGKKHWTKGMPSRPYMYDTAQMLRRAIPDIGREVMDDDRR